MQEYFSYLLRCLLSIIKKWFNLLRSDIPTMIRIQIRECILQSLLLQQLFLVTGSNQKLSKINQPRTIRIDHFQDLIDASFRYLIILVFFEYCDELLFCYDSVAVLVDLSETLEELLFVLVGVQLGGDVGVYNCF